MWPANSSPLLALPLLLRLLGASGRRVQHHAEVANGVIPDFSALPPSDRAGPVAKAVVPSALNEGNPLCVYHNGVESNITDTLLDWPVQWVDFVDGHWFGFHWALVLEIQAPEGSAPAAGNDKLYVTVHRVVDYNRTAKKLLEPCNHAELVVYTSREGAKSRSGFYMPGRTLRVFDGRGYRLHDVVDYASSVMALPMMGHDFHTLRNNCRDFVRQMLFKFGWASPSSVWGIEELFLSNQLRNEESGPSAVDCEVSAHPCFCKSVKGRRDYHWNRDCDKSVRCTWTPEIERCVPKCGAAANQNEQNCFNGDFSNCVWNVSKLKCAVPHSQSSTPSASCSVSDHPCICKSVKGYSDYTWTRDCERSDRCSWAQSIERCVPICRADENQNAQNCLNNGVGNCIWNATFSLCHESPYATYAD